ncbi:MAG: porin [Burkholderiaceae bacterium]
MKKSLLALAVLGAFTGVASAATANVEVFGIIDLSIRQTKNDGGDARTTMANDNLNSNRLGFRGTEDLGGGLKAGFHLEGGMAPDVGTAAGFTLARKSTVALMSGLGEIRLGRDYTPTFYNTSAFDPFGTNGAGTSFITSRAANALAVPTYVRSNNAASYFLPALGGVYGQVMLAPGEGGVGKYTGGRIGFAAGPFDVAASAGNTEMNIAGTLKAKIFNAAGSYKIGPAKLMVQYNDEKVELTPTTEDKQVRILLGANVTMGQGEIRGSWIKADNKTVGATNNDATHVTLGYIYNLSTRTALYATWASVTNKGTANSAIGPAGVATPTPGGKSTALEGGLRHSF